MLVCSTPATAQVALGDDEIVAIIEHSKRAMREADEEYKRRAEDSGSAGVQVANRRRADEAAARSRAEFLTKYDQFARRVRALVEEMKVKPGVVPLDKLKEVQKAWAAWQKCSEWPAADQ
jgi:hypothetical protein